MKKWEYCSVDISGNDDRNEKVLDELGSEGWELVTTYHVEYWLYGDESTADKFVFKREIEQK